MELWDVPNHKDYKVIITLPGVLWSPFPPVKRQTTCHIECREVRLDVSVLAGMLAPLQFITLLSAT